MTTEQELLIALCRLAIHPDEDLSEVLKVSDIDWNSILKESQKQSLIGIAYRGVKLWCASEFAKKNNATIDKKLVTKWYGLSERIREDNYLLNKRTVQVCQNIAKDGLRISVMKGQGNALLYGQDLYLLRSPGDIDVWVDGGFQKVYDYVMEVAPTNVVNEKEIDFNVFSDVSVEVHYRPLILRHPFRNRKLQTFFARHAADCFNNREKLPVLNNAGEEIWKEAIITSLSFNLVHQLAHIHLHLFTEGVGLRQVMDYYYLLVHAEKGLTQFEKEEVIHVVSSVNLEKLARALMWILSKYFGLDKKCQLWEASKEDGLFLLEEILKTGNFGHNDKRRPDTIDGNSIKSFIYVQKRNIAMSRFDRTDWFWGSIWRIYHFTWRKWKGFRH